MRYILILVLLLLTVPLLAQNPLPEWITRTNATATTAWDSIFVTGRDFQPITGSIFNYSFTDTLKLSRQNDTLAAKVVNIPPRTSYSILPTYAKWLKIKTTGTSTKYDLSLNGNYGTPDRWTGIVVRDSIQRPADAIAYAAKDVWSNSTSAPTLRSLLNVVRFNGGTGILQSISVESDTAQAITVTIWLFADTVTALNDNVVYTMTPTNSLRRIGKVTVSLMTEGTGSTGAYGEVDYVGKIFRTSTNSRHIHYLVETETAFTPKVSGKLYITARILQE